LTTSPPRKPGPLEQVGKQDLLGRLRIDPALLQQVGGIIVIGSMIEFRIERTIWAVEGHSPHGQRPPTDAKQISELVRRLRDWATSQADEQRAKFALAWCDAAEPAFRCRNSLVHGVPLSIGDGLTEFMANTRWSGELRKRPPSSFSADKHTLGLLQMVLTTLYWSIAEIEDSATEPSAGGRLELLQGALREARSVAWELSDLAVAVNHEKY